MRGELQAVFWAAMTIGLYLASVAIYKRHVRWWTSPLLVTWAACTVLALILHTTYRDYIVGTHWLVAMLGPATVAFAMPIYEQRRLIRRYWPTLALGVAVGSTIAFGSSWLLAKAFGLSSEVQRSLLPRSVTTPFAVEFAKSVGGMPEMTVACVVVTGILGASLGEFLLKLLPLRSALARGSLLGMGAHAVGTAKARQVGDVEGSVAGLTMVLAGLFSVLAAPILSRYVH